MITTTIHRLGVASAMRVGAVLGALSTAVFGLLYTGLTVSVMELLGSGVTRNGVGVLSVVWLVAICFGFGISALLGAIGGLVIAFLYNLTSNWVGGLQVQLRLPDGVTLADEPPTTVTRKPHPAPSLISPASSTRATDDDVSLFD